VGSIYPKPIAERVTRTAPTADFRENGRGRDASFECGCISEFALAIGHDQSIENISFSSNGCGYMIAAASALSEALERSDLRELQGANNVSLASLVEAVLGAFPESRRHCLATPITALRLALADHRERFAAEFRGESALICTCFGITEDRIIEAASDPAADPETIAERTNAGRGCGSCRPLIDEILSITRRRSV
jgi:bacterioferritin-associated ferredoxin/NifU-like protein involved in Fe-S cluster formation